MMRGLMTLLPSARRLCCAALAVACIPAAPGRALAEDAAESPAPARTFEDVKDELNAMVQEERDSVRQSRELVAEISRIGAREARIRERLLGSDPDLKALHKQIKQKQDELERLLREKDPVLAAMMEKRTDLINQHGKVQSRISELQAKRTALFNEVNPKSAEMKP